LVAIIAVLTMAGAAPAQAAPNVAYAWGANNKGQLGDGSTEGPEECSGSSVNEAHTACSTSPIAVSGLSGVTAIAAGGGLAAASGHALALLENGAVMAWGENSEGQLGNGESSGVSDVPVAVCALGETAPCVKHLEGVTAIAAAGHHSMALLASGVVVEWGELSTGGRSNVPVEVAGLSGVTAITTGGEGSLAVVSGGKVMAWGNGRLGNGTSTGSTAPVPVCAAGTVGTCPSGPYLEGVSAVAASHVHSLALLSNGAVVAWGKNDFGQLGNGTTTESLVPVAVSGLSGVTAVAAGNTSADNGFSPFSVALLSGGTVRAWGGNNEGQLGDGTDTGPELCAETNPCSKTPVAVKGLSGVTAIAAHGKHSLALLKGGAVMAWGSNEFGTLGIGTSAGPEPCGILTEGSCSTKPVAVLTHGAMAGVGAGDANSLAFGPPPPPASNLPELGRCVKAEAKKEGSKTVYNGAYAYPNCLVLSATHKGKYEWHPGPGAAPKFSGTSVSSTLLETVGKAKISCAAAELTGEYTGAKTASVAVKFIGCDDQHSRSCQSAAYLTEGEIQSPTPEEAELGFITGGEKPIVGLDLKPKSPSTNLWAFECGQPPEKNVVHGVIEGSAIARIAKIDVASEEFTLTYKQKVGVQAPERFEGGLKDTLLFTTTSGVEKGEKSEEQAALAAVATLPGEEPLEIKAKP
jgi:alpha-tubulin suppressor-like RCC1 family protein